VTATAFAKCSIAFSISPMPSSCSPREISVMKNFWTAVSSVRSGYFWLIISPIIDTVLIY
jgi:hypothetical protein